MTQKAKEIAEEKKKKRKQRQLLQRKHEKDLRAYIKSLGLPEPSPEEMKKVKKESREFVAFHKTMSYCKQKRFVQTTVKDIEFYPFAR